MFKKVLLTLVFVLALPLALAACSEPQVMEVTREVVITETITETVTEMIDGEEVVVEVTRVVEVPADAPEAEEPDAPMPVDRTGAWLDTVVVVEEPSQDAAITRLLAGDIDIFATGIANPVIADRIAESADLNSVRSFGLYDELSFNPAGPEFEDGSLNPFAVAEIREAMNWLINRDHIAQELYGGLAIARWLPISPAGSDYARLADVARALEAQYAYDMDRAAEVIGAEMEALGAEMDGGVWTYNGDPVEITLLIRNEDTRLQIGDYVANQLEDIGFTTIRDYRTAAEASPIWYSGDPALGEWHIYTGGWSATLVSRDDGGNFAFFYTDMGLPSPLWAGYQNDPAYYELAQRLDNNDFATLDERRDMMAEALELAMRDSYRVWTSHRASETPMNANVSVASDLFAGVAGGGLWASTLRRTGEVGGSMRVALPSILTEPWNPVAGSNWLFDAMLFRGTGEQAVVFDPYTGLGLPNRIERAEVMAVEGLPIGQTLDWVDLEFVSEIVVPEDAWADWDAAEQRWLTVGEVYTDTHTALLKSTVYYPADMYDTIAWHDGSAISAADFVMFMIIQFDRAKEESAIFDASRVSPFNSFMSAFKGMRIVSEDPLVIEHYTDNYQLDAELNVTTWWPQYAQGPGAWHNIAIAVMAEADEAAVFSQAKASELEVDRFNYIAGETVAILRDYLDVAVEEGNTIPYAPTLGEYISEDAAAERYANLTEWHRTRGHFWLGTGVFYLERAFPVEGTVILQRNANHPDPSDKWDRFAAAAIPEVEVDGPNQVDIGSEAVFEVFVDFDGAPYAVDDVTEVKFLVIDADGEISHVGEATAVADGLWEIVLDAEITGALTAGSNRLEAIVVSNRVAMPSFDSILFVTSP
jgi:peptide/nickel transport system substrate-binding protein